MGFSLRTDRWRLLVLFTLAVGVRLLYTCSTSPDSHIGSVDAWGYHRLALNVDEGNGFSLRRGAPFVPDSVRTPLYPAFLLLIRRSLGSAPRTAAIVQAVLDGFTTLLAWWLAARLGGHRAGRVAALLYALNPTQIRYANELLTETLLSFLLTLCVCALVQYVRLASSHSCTNGSKRPGDGTRARISQITWLSLVAVLTGLAVLCKPNVQLLPLVWVLVIALVHEHDWRRSLVDASVMTVTVACILAPWIVRNHLFFGRPFLSTAFEGNVSRISAPATLAFARQEYVAPWSTEWEALFGEIVSQAAARYRWHKPWGTLTARELDAHNRQVFLVARQVLRQHPLAWLGSHLQGMVRYLEPQTFRVCYARFSGREWPPDILEDAIVHVLRAVGRGDWAKAGQVIAEERWAKFDVLRGVIWWGTFGGQVIGLILMLRGAYKMYRRPLKMNPALTVALLSAIGYVLFVPGPIAYERFRVPVTGLIVTLIGVSSSVDSAHVSAASALQAQGGDRRGAIRIR